MNCDNYIPVSAELVSEPALACPVCGDQHVHPVGIECRSPGKEKGLVTIDADGVAIDPHKEARGRGTEITLKFTCECGHAFEYVLLFHKGSTLVSRSMWEMTGKPDQWPDTIWRN